MVIHAIDQHGDPPELPGLHPLSALLRLQFWLTDLDTLDQAGVVRAVFKRDVHTGAFVSVSVKLPTPVVGGVSK